MSFTLEHPLPILGRPITLEEWAAMDEDEPGELVDGRLEEEEAPGIDHDERRDRIEKMTDYASFGIRFYWIVDPMLRSLEIFELVDGRYARAAVGTEGTLHDVPGCAGLTVDLDDLWAELAELESE